MSRFDQSASHVTATISAAVSASDAARITNAIMSAAGMMTRNANLMMWTASPQRHHSAKAWSQERHKEGDRP